MTQIELGQYGIEVSEPVCKPKNGKRKFQVVPTVTGDNDYEFPSDDNDILKLDS